ncbi:unnamed protein product [Owenia fusiformis]|uniref:E3 ubiquitin-protein ligase listerin n=1 Tax=Owenia fusiformis TaxID=6347 RepID=A0A8J1XH57_OWEFU|nr:unnamed protein product [Owenia fusiformis]
MGGKQKSGQTQANRTKGNVKPSSSSRAAEQLTTPGGATGFVGFGALSGDLGYVPTAQGSDEADSNVDADFRMVLRKLAKKDATTKLKALQEFSTLCKEKETDIVLGALPFWPRLYNKMALDNDRKVREATQLAFEQLVLRVRRNLAPHLKSLMGCWLLSQCDSHPPAASAATAAFLAALPVAKQADAILFCKTEVMNYLQDNLIQQTIETLSDARLYSKDEMESKYYKVISSTLLAWKLFISTVPDVQQQSLHDKYSAILNEGKFWKYGKHKSSMIRSSFYSVISTLCLCVPDLCQQYADKICPLVLYNLDEPDPLICPTLWEAVLVVVTKIPDCWTKINPNKGMVPKLFVLFKQGGSGNAVSVFPNILPFLSKLPDDVIGTDRGERFYNQFFSNMIIGLKQDKVQVSPSETAAILNAYMECQRYLITQNIDDDVVWRNLFADHVLPLLKQSFTEDSPCLSNSPLYSLLVDMMAYFTMKAKTHEKKSDYFQQVINCIWSDLNMICLNMVDVENKTPSHVNRTLGRLAEFLKCFSIVSKEPKSNKKVLFIDTPDSKSRPPVAIPQKDDKHEKQLQSSNKSEAEKIKSAIWTDNKRLQVLVSKTCQISYQRARADPSIHHLKLISTIISTYPNVKTIQGMIENEEQAASDSDVSANVVFQNVFHKELLPWVLELEEATKHKELELVVAIISAVYQQVDPSVKVEILQNMCQHIASPLVLHTMLRPIVSQSNPKEVNVWLKGPTLGERLTLLTQQLCRESLEGDGADLKGDRDPENCWKLLSLGLSTDEHFEPLIDQKYVDQILAEIMKALPSGDRSENYQPVQVNRCVSFVCDIAHNFFSNVKGCLMMASTEDLLLSLFKISLQDIPKLTGDTYKKVNHTWCEGVSSLVRQKGGFIHEEGFFYKATQELRHQLSSYCTKFNRVTSLSKVGLQLVEMFLSNLPHTAGEDDLDLADPSIQPLLELLTIPMSHGHNSQWKIIPLINSDLTLTFGAEDKIDQSDAYVNSYITPCISTIAFTSTILVERITKPRQQHSDNDLMIEALLDLSYGVSLCNAMLGDKKQQLNDTELSQVCLFMENNLIKILDNSDHTVCSTLIDGLLKRSLTNGNLWSVALGLVLGHLNKDGGASIDIVAKLGGLDRFSTLDDACLHTIESTLSHIKLYQQLQMVDFMVAKVISCPPENITNIDGALGPLSVITKVCGYLETVSEDTNINPEALVGVLNEILVWRDRLEQLFLFHRSPTDVAWPVMQFNLQLMRYLEMMLTKLTDKLTETHWDFIMCSMVAWIQSAHEGLSDKPSELASSVFSVASFSFLSKVSESMDRVTDNPTANLPANLVMEWNEFFSQGAYSVLLPLFVELIGTSDSSIQTSLVIKSLGEAISFCPVDHIKNHQLPAKLIATQEDGLPHDVQTLLNHLCPLLVTRQYAVQLTAYKLLLRFMPVLATYNTTTESEEDKETRPLPSALMQILDTTSHAMQVILQGVKVGDCLQIDPHIEEYNYAIGYHLVWKLLLAFFKGATAENRAQYANALRDNGSVSRLLSNLFCIMPDDPSRTCQFSQVKGSSPMTVLSPKGKMASQNMFGTSAILDIKAPCLHEDLEHLSCSVYYDALQDLPVMARHWWSGLDKSTAALVDRYTADHVSPLLCSAEIQAVRNEETKLENLSIRARPTAREVIATYEKEELTIELVIALPRNHPLSTITVTSEKKHGVAMTQWRNWMLQLTKFLAHQNGSIIDGLSLWKRNVDKRFEGVEDCMICFAVIHMTTCQLPKLQCKTCKKKFHSACLYKWFNTSNNSTCPLCRNLF